jgi:MoxR-like ATPase
MTSPVRVAAAGPCPLPAAKASLEAVAANLARAVLGKEGQIRQVVTCLVAGGHLLIEDVPGVGKTTLAEALARSCDLTFARVQFTADLMPTDLVGTQVLVSQSNTFQFRPGPLFHQLILADELNRAPPRTQSALLEALAHGQISVDGHTHPLPNPFVVVATQNPVDWAGTYPLPDSQLDRFLMRLSLGHPSLDVEVRMLAERGRENPALQLQPAITGPGLIAVQALADRVTVHPHVADYMARLAHATRSHPDLERGVSTRALLALSSAARAHALWEPRDFVTPGDVRAVVGPCWAHRLLWRSPRAPGTAREEALPLLEELVRKTPAPR